MERPEQRKANSQARSVRRTLPARQHRRRERRSCLWATGDDVWSLCVLLLEMGLGGEHPFAASGDGVERVADRIRRRRLAAGTRSAAGSERRRS